MTEPHETDRRLPPWTDDVLNAEQRRVLSRRFGLSTDDDVLDADVPPPDRGGEGEGGASAPTSPPAPAFLTTPAKRDRRR